MFTELVSFTIQIETEALKLFSAHFFLLLPLLHHLLLFSLKLINSFYHCGWLETNKNKEMEWNFKRHELEEIPFTIIYYEKTKIETVGF